MPRNCFVIMPIRKPGTDEFLHFRTIRDTIIEPALVAQGYAVERADDINQSGAITADIIERLANADLVVADLTDQNPNVFYELGVRHVLKKHGTIMLVDETRTEIPFDLAQYRVIKYEPSLAGAEHVRRKLHDYADPDLTPSTADNPVHTFLPALPADVVAQVSGSTEGKLREELSAARALLAQYELEFGRPEGSRDRVVAVLDDLVNQSRAGLLPEDLVSQARAAFERRDTRAFLEICRTLFGSGSRLQTRQFAELASWSSNLGLVALETTIYEYGKHQYPDDDSFERIVLSSMAHSSDASSRQQARERYLSILHITRSDDGDWELPQDMSERDLTTLAVALDTFHRDEMEAEALEIARKLVTRYPDSDIALRNFARALEGVNQTERAVTAYRAALAYSTDATTARWFANTLNQRRRYLDAAEVSVAGAILDPDDAESFLDASGRLKDALEEVNREALPFLAKGRSDRDTRALPPGVDRELVDSLVLAAFAAPDLTSDDLNQAVRDFGADMVQSLLQNRQAGAIAMSKDEREAAARRVYDQVASELTTEVSDVLPAFQLLLLEASE